MAVLKQSNFRIEEKVKKVSFELECELTLTEDSLTWKWQPGPPGTKHTTETEKTVGLDRVLAAVVETKPSEEDKDEDIPSKLVVHYIKRMKPPHFELCLEKVVLQGPCSLCKDWVNLLKSHLQRKFPQRPKSLLIIINPCSGGKKGEKLYQSDIAPIFELCGIKTDVRVTTKPKDPINILNNYDLSQVDGVISMGGDGTHFEVLSALISTTMKASGVEEITPDTVLQSPAVKHGSIPAGTGNGGQLLSTYNKDPVTSAIVIVLGDSKPRDILTICSGGKFISSCFLASTYGLLAQALDIIENYRWIGPLRYFGFATVVKHQPTDMVIDYLPEKSTGEAAAGVSDDKTADDVTDVNTAAGVSDDNTATGVSEDNTAAGVSEDNTAAGVSKDNKADNVTDVNTGEDTQSEKVKPSDTSDVIKPGVHSEDPHHPDLPQGWQRIEESLLTVDFFCLANMDTVDMYGLYMTEHTMPSGVFTLTVTRPCGRIAHMKYMGKLIAGKMGQGMKECDAVEVMNVRACRIRAVPRPGDNRPMSRISCDGETAVITDHQFEIRCHAGLISTYARTDGAELRQICEKDASVKESKN